VMEGVDGEGEEGESHGDGSERYDGEWLGISPREPL
jgi:hypothetical protein